MAKILVIADIKDGVLKGSTAELLSKAKGLGAETAVAAIGNNIESLTEIWQLQDLIPNTLPMMQVLNYFLQVPMHPVLLKRQKPLKPP
jgi:hypothetical protein